MADFHYIVANEDAYTLVYLKGDLVNEIKATFEAIESSLVTRDIVFDCSELEKLNSIGVRHWMMFLDRIAKNHTFTFRNCSESFIDTALMIPGFTRNNKIESFFTSFDCQGCTNEKSLLISFVDGRSVVPSSVTCEKCGNKMAPDESLEDHLNDLAS